MIYEAILTVFYTILFIVIINKSGYFRIEGISIKLMSLIFIIKVMVGTMLLLIYTYYYKDRPTSDIHKYFTDGNIMYNALFKNPADYLKMLTGIGSDSEHLKEYYNNMDFWIKSFNYELYNDNRTVIRFNAFVRIFSFGYLNVHNVFMSFLSFVGLTGIYKSFIKYYYQKRYLLIIAIFMFPSVLFWSSGALKEGIVVFAFGILFYGFYNIITKNYKIRYFIFILTGLYLLLISKFYVLIAALPGLTFLYWHYMSKTRKNIIIKFLIVHTIILGMAFNSKYIIHKYDFPAILSQKQHDFINMVKTDGNVGSYIEIPELEPTTYSLIQNAPGAFFRTLTRPHIFETHNIISIPAALENFAIIFLIILSIIFFDKRNYHSNTGLLFFSISFVLVLFTLCGLTTPVLGALVRYKIPALPFLIIIFTALIDKNKIKNIFKSNKK